MEEDAKQIFGPAEKENERVQAVFKQTKIRPEGLRQKFKKDKR